ncbi:Uncharacterised protein [Oligella urethralis]|uniref:BREX-1 system adenine-specific DNA-methyltransferase PglX n=1 Tax=Oligella urethralis TaxID=90245 RepID=UPI000DFB74C7|nr:BREX-1 system adenine-specific DNA-methyltransferase PglX [Oligella urethralis]SUA65232.1 Uncharacterised protein [Oligella urethralis]
MNQTQNNKEKMEKYFFRASAEDFKKIPGSPIAYWVSGQILSAFTNGVSLIDLARPCQGMATTNNGLFLRQWFEVSSCRTGFLIDNQEKALVSGYKWFPYNKGGDFRKWYGNCENVVNYENGGKTICDYIDNTPGARVNSKGRVINRDKYFKESISWSKISSGNIALRYYSKGFIFDVAGCSIFADTQDLKRYAGLLNSYVCRSILEALSPTLNFEVGHINSLPILPQISDSSLILVNEIVDDLINSAKSDWDSYETSWDFKSLPLLQPEHHHPSLKASYHSLRTHWREMTLEMQRLEEENNRIFIDAYGLQDELTPEVPLREITLTCNPHYRYGGEKIEEELEALLLADTMRELVSYAVGCMFGRYSLDKEGLILANQGETLDDYLAQVPQPSFPADKDNVIPILDDDWFADDISERFRQFLRVAFGEEHYEDNLVFIEQALNIKNKRYYSLRDYFLSEFYNDHVKRYKKRPIYWLFSSPKGSFNALIYMHRYRTDTVSVVLNDYLREFRTKLASHKSHLEAVSISANSTPSDKTKALKEIEKLNKTLVELEEYERDVLYPLATKQLAIDLDDGVKANYPKFGTALKKVVGL